MKRFQEVTPGILRGGLPTPEEIRVLKDIWGVVRIISLDLEAGRKIDPVCKQLDIEHLILPIEHDEIYSDENRIRNNVKFLSDKIIPLLTDRQPVYIHCIHGRDRTGLAIALYRIKKQGWSVKKALNEARSLGFGDGLSPEHLELFISTINQTKPKKDSNQSDVVSRARDTFDPGSATGAGTGFNYFSPIPPVQEFVMGYPKPSLPPESFSSDDKRRRKRKIRKTYLQDLNDAMAYVGVNNTVNPILRYVNPLGGNLSPEGVGPMGIMPYGTYYL